MENETLDYDGEEIKPTNEQRYTTIGGWLLLPIFGLIISPFKLVISIFKDLLPALKDENMQLFEDPSSEMYSPALRYILYGEIVGNAFFAVFAIVILTYVFRYKVETPRLVIAFLASNLLFILCDYIIIYLLGFGTTEVFMGAEIIRIVISCGIWIPYFLTSERVKGTFVK